MYVHRYKDERNNERLIKDRNHLVDKSAPRSKAANKRCYVYTYVCVQPRYLAKNCRAI